MPLTRRTQILLDDERQALLRRRSAATGKSVGELIRDAIDLIYAGEQERQQAAAERRQAAFTSLLEAEPVDVGEWEDVKAEIEAGYERTIDGSS